MSGMPFTQYDLGHHQRGEIVEVTLKGNASSVRLMDSSDFSAFKAGRRHSYFGGLVKKSPAKLTIPHSGRWYVTVDMMGLKGQVRSSARVLPKALPPAKETSWASPSVVVQELPSVASPIVGSAIVYDYDVFVCHASEDKDEVVRPLAHGLRDAGLRVWYDEFELRIGDSLRGRIDHGLTNSRIGLVVFSPNFFEKGWSRYELNGLIAKMNVDGSPIFPVWHNISMREIMRHSPALVDIVALKTADHSIAKIAGDIAAFVGRSE